MSAVAGDRLGSGEILKDMKTIVAGFEDVNGAAAFPKKKVVLITD